MLDINEMYSHNEIRNSATHSLIENVQSQKYEQQQKKTVTPEKKQRLATNTEGSIKGSQVHQSSGALLDMRTDKPFPSASEGNVPKLLGRAVFW